MKATFKEYLQYQNSDTDLQELFYNMSKTMKYIHSYDYYINGFNSEDIEILNVDKKGPIKYKNIKKMLQADDYEAINKDIKSLAILQIAVYTNLLPYINLSDSKYIDFLNDNFVEYRNLLPSDDVRYFEGIIKRNNSVYYSDYINRKNELELHKLEGELAEGSNRDYGSDRKVGIQKTKSTSAGSMYTDIDRETKQLYDDLNERQQAAFTNFIILPIVMILLGIVSSIIVMFFK